MNKNPRLDPEGTLPLLPGWVGITEAGELLGVTRQHAYRMAEMGKFESLCRIGKAHIFVVSMDEVERMRVQRASRNTPESPE